MKWLAHSYQETRKLGAILAKKILKSRIKKSAFVLGVIGELGTGKTTFLQGFAQGLRVKERILSPTFVLMKKFQILKSKPQTNSKYKIPEFQNFYHFDCYRIKKVKEILELGFKEIISTPQNIVVVEWADRIRKILPKQSLLIKFEFLGKNQRKITIIK